jgi:hypothetical protein
VGTFTVESLTSYINRLAGMYRVSPQMLVAQEILPVLRGAYHFRSFPRRLSGFVNLGAMRINGTTEMALDWSSTLERLTLRSDLGHLTIHSWATGLPVNGLLREIPYFCPTCYQQWQEQGLPIYQPLIWMLQVVTLCMQHQQKLIEACPSCGKSPSVMASKKTSPGHCTWCGTWLGGQPAELGQIDEETLDWQAWVRSAVEDLHVASLAFGRLQWNRFSTTIAVCIEALGGTQELARLMNRSNALFSLWQNGKHPASLLSVLEVGYALDISPVQFFISDPQKLKDMLLLARQAQKPFRSGCPKSAPMDRTSLPPA